MNQEFIIAYNKDGDEVHIGFLIRCRDCDYWRDIDGIFGECHNGCYDMNWFCADGKRKE